jgi:hypothetical protein
VPLDAHDAEHVRLVRAVQTDTKIARRSATSIATTARERIQFSRLKQERPMDSFKIATYKVSAY